MDLNKEINKECTLEEFGMLMSMFNTKSNLLLEMLRYYNKRTQVKRILLGGYQDSNLKSLLYDFYYEGGVKEYEVLKEGYSVLEPAAHLNFGFSAAISFERIDYLFDMFTEFPDFTERLKLNYELKDFLNNYFTAVYQTKERYYNHFKNVLLSNIGSLDVEQAINQGYNMYVNFTPREDDMFDFETNLIVHSINLLLMGPDFINGYDYKNPEKHIIDLNFKLDCSLRKEN